MNESYVNKLPSRCVDDDEGEEEEDECTRADGGERKREKQGRRETRRAK